MKYSNYSIAQNQASQMSLDRGARMGKIAVKKGFRTAKKGAGMALGAIKANPGKAGMALAGLAAAGGLGIAGIKAMRKPKSLQDRLKGQASKMFR